MRFHAYKTTPIKEIIPVNRNTVEYSVTHEPQSDFTSHDINSRTSHKKRVKPKYKRNHAKSAIKKMAGEFGEIDLNQTAMPKYESVLKKTTIITHTNIISLLRFHISKFDFFIKTKGYGPIDARIY
jgi:hypothetical protein